MIDAEQGDAAATGNSKRPRKSADAFRTIGEVGQALDVPQHVLRFWESKFTQVKPLKRGGGRRYYRPQDVVLLRGIRNMLYVDGYTIRGVQKVLREGGVRVLQERGAEDAPDATEQGTEETAPAAAAQPAEPDDQRAALRAVLSELEEMRRLLNDAGK